MLEFCGENAEWDRCEFEGEEGEVLCVQLPGTLMSRWVGDANITGNADARHEVFDERLAQLIELLWDAACSGPTPDPLYVEGLSLSIAGLVINDYWKGEPRKQVRGGLSTQQQRSVLDFIEAKLSGELTVEQLAGLLAMSADHFSRLFKLTFGQSPYAFVLDRRLKASARALRRTPDLPVSVVALAHGFNSQQHFTEAFKRKMGTTPSKWRDGT